MGIALEYAFLVAIAGGIAAICVAYVLEIREDAEMRHGRDAGRGIPATAHVPLRRAVSGTRVRHTSL